MESNNNIRRLIVDDDGMMTIPDDILKELDWKEGDELEWIDLGNGQLELRKLNNDTEQQR